MHFYVFFPLQTLNTTCTTIVHTIFILGCMYIIYISCLLQVTDDASLAAVDRVYRQLRRLPVLRYLSMGSSLSANRWIPVLSSPSSSKRTPSEPRMVDNFKGWNDFFKVWEELDEYYDKTQSSPLRSSQEAEGADQGGDLSNVTANEINDMLRKAANSEMRMRLS